MADTLHSLDARWALERNPRHSQVAGLPRGVVASAVRRPHSPEASGSSSSSRSRPPPPGTWCPELRSVTSTGPPGLREGTWTPPLDGRSVRGFAVFFELSALSCLPQLGPDLNGLWSGSAEHLVLYLVVSLRPWDGDPSYRSRVPLWGQASSSRRCVSHRGPGPRCPRPHAHIRHTNVC